MMGRCVDVWVGNRPIKGGLFESNKLIRCHSTQTRDLNTKSGIKSRDNFQFAPHNTTGTSPPNERGGFLKLTISAFLTDQVSLLQWVLVRIIPFFVLDLNFLRARALLNLSAMTIISRPKLNLCV